MTSDHLPRRLLAAGALLLAACGHSDAFTPPDHGTDQPRAGGVPVRLTWNYGEDKQAAWLPGTAGILYSRERPDRTDRDRCLAELPPGGGRIRREICEQPVFSQRSADALESPAPAADGRLLYVRSTAPAGAGLPAIWEVVLAAADGSAPAKLLQTPYAGPSGYEHQRATGFDWLAADELVYVGEMVSFVQTPAGDDTVTTGRDAMRLRLTAGGPETLPIPDTFGASSVAGGPDRGTVFYTLNGDGRVYRRQLATGETDLAYDFGATIVRDVDYHDGRLAAVVGGQVTYELDEVLGPVQRDVGGVVWLVDLAAGTAQPLPAAGLLLRRPRFSPDGTRLVADAVEEAGGVWRNLWLYELP